MCCDKVLPLWFPRGGQKKNPLTINRMKSLTCWRWCSGITSSQITFRGHLYRVRWRLQKYSPHIYIVGGFKLSVICLFSLWFWNSLVVLYVGIRIIIHICILNIVRQRQCPVEEQIFPRRSCSKSKEVGTLGRAELFTTSQNRPTTYRRIVKTLVKKLVNVIH